MKALQEVLLPFIVAIAVATFITLDPLRMVSPPLSRSTASSVA